MFSSAKNLTLSIVGLAVCAVKGIPVMIDDVNQKLCNKIMK